MQPETRLAARFARLSQLPLTPRSAVESEAGCWRT